MSSQKETFMEAQRHAKLQIIQRWRQLANVADAVGMTTLANDIRTSRIPKVEAERFHVVVLGEFNHGKSTFVNSLLGADVLPTGITPTTAAINHIVWAPSPHARVVLQSGDTRPLDLGAVKEWVTVAGGRANEVAHVEIGYPCELLANNVVLVDTPGVNDLNEQRAEVTYGYVPRADAVLFLLDAGQALKDSEREFLRSRVLEASRDRLIFVLGKMDLLNDDERTAVIDYVRRGLGAFVPAPKLFPVSAKAYRDRKEPSGMSELVSHLATYLAGERAQILLDNAAADAERTGAYLMSSLGVRIAAFTMNVDQLQARVVAVRAHLSDSKRKLDELHVRIDTEAAAMKAQIALDVDAFVHAFVAALPEQIAAADADDLQRYLPAFIEDKFKEWAEAQSAKVATLLQRLAEEIIQITNENVSEAAAVVAEKLGSESVKVDISVDSFKYDVGIYAVGALGTGLMLFVNGLAGGLLTLAAPILAILLKSKVAGDIKKQAATRAPETILAVGANVKPYFDSVVDEFAARLSAFVTNAGNALYRGISDVLEQTIRERKAAGDNAEALRQTTEGWQVQLAEARSELAQLREVIWSSGGAN